MATTERKQYFATYAFGSEVTTEESKNLIGNEAVVGAEVDLAFEPNEAGRIVTKIVSTRGYPLGAFDKQDGKDFEELHKSGMECKAYLSSVIYAEATGIFWGEYLVVFYRSEDKDAILSYCTRLAAKIARGIHPDPKLDAEGLSKVRETGGTVCEAQPLPPAKLKKGVVYFKKKRSFADGLVNNATKGNRGCAIAGYIFWALLAVAIIFGIWKLFFA